MVRAVFSFLHGDLSVAESSEKAAGSMEAIDVERGEYEVIYDDTGVRYEPVVDGYQVRLQPTETQDYEDLVARLKAFAERAGLDLPADGPDFPVLAARRISEEDWKHRWPKRPAWLSRRLHGSEPPRFDGAT